MWPQVREAKAKARRLWSQSPHWCLGSAQGIVWPCGPHALAELLQAPLPFAFFLSLKFLNYIIYWETVRSK